MSVCLHSRLFCGCYGFWPTRFPPPFSRKLTTPNSSVAVGQRLFCLQGGWCSFGFDWHPQTPPLVIRDNFCLLSLSFRICVSQTTRPCSTFLEALHWRYCVMLVFIHGYRGADIFLYSSSDSLDASRVWTFELGTRR